MFQLDSQRSGLINSGLLCCDIISQAASVTPELQTCVCVPAARFFFSFSPSEKENSDHRGGAPQTCSLLVLVLGGVGGVRGKARGASSLLPEHWLPRSPLIDPPLGRLWPEKTTCWLHACDLFRSLSL